MIGARFHRWRMRAWLCRLHEGELSSRKAQTLRAHLAHCSHCTTELARLESTDRLLIDARPALTPLPPGDARALFHEALETSGVLRRRPRHSLAWALPALIAVVLVAVAGTSRVLLSSRGQSIGTPTQMAVVPALPAPVSMEVAGTAKPEAVVPLEVLKAGSSAPRRSIRKPRRRERQRRLAWRSHRIRRQRPTVALALQDSSVQAEAPQSPTPPPHLLVMVTTAPAPPIQPAVTVREMDKDAPSFARASAFHASWYGGGLLNEFTLASNRLTRQTNPLADPGVPEEQKQ